jgi:DNA-binding beta-propeller fold protein YncE
MYIADTGNRRVVILDGRANFVGAITTGASGPLQAPYSLAESADGHLIVLDSDAGRVLEYDASGKLVRESDPALGLIHSRGIAVDREGHVLVADPAANAIDTLGSDLSLLHQQAAELPGGTPLFNQPSAVAVGPDGSIFVVDSQNNRLIQFTATWQEVRSWPIVVPDTLHSPRVVPLPDGRVVVSDPRDGKLLLYAPSALQPAVYDLPTGAGAPMPLGISMDRNGKLLVACSGINTVLEVTTPGGV